MSLKILRIGDPHIRPNNIVESDLLMSFALQTAVNAKVNRLEILGDLFHTHSVIRLEVLEFWDKWLQVFRDKVHTIVLVGNHDQTGDYNKSSSHSLTVFKRLQNENLRIIDAPTQIGVFGYLPYIHGESEFNDAAQNLFDSGAKILVCHTEFSGSQYDNGFYSPHGFNPDNIPFDTIISGHIHKEQIIAGGKVDYPGTPKWDTASDVNEQKGIWLYEHDDSGKVINRDRISTAHVCTPIISFTWLEGQEQPVIPEGSRATVELIGSSDWISKQKAILKGKVGIKSKTTDQKRKSERKAGNSLENYLLNMYDTRMDRTVLIQLAKEIGIV
jgi:DNA repair exonuclease SbcCD nuclease subunit